MNCSNEAAGYIWHELYANKALNKCLTCGSQIAKCCRIYLKTGKHS